MSKRSSPKRDELRAEYDFASMQGGVRGKYSRRYRASANLALLDPEVAKAFPSDTAVNEALRTVLRATRAHRRARLPGDPPTNAALTADPRRWADQLRRQGMPAARAARGRVWL
jgi:hypothetical protein